MKSLLLFSMTMLLFAFSVIGQNFIYKGDQPYLATNTWLFQCEHYDYPLEVQIAKTSTGGYLRIATEVLDQIFYIGGSAFVLLDDGSMITCTDKGVRDYVDEKSVALYSFTQAEMDRLKTMNIQTIRFSIKAPKGLVGGNAGSYTAENSKYSPDQTAVEISSLFK
ncbi:MAG: hypothetical protein KA239_05400 [Bacteroidia bacterium]|nr:hypothetical protein [Bacteroidia bacterium]